MKLKLLGVKGIATKPSKETFEEFAKRTYSPKYLAALARIDAMVADLKKRKKKEW